MGNKLETGKDLKNFREKCRDCNQINQTSKIPNNIFTESLNSPEKTAAILFNCLKNLKGKIMEISASSKETKATQIKGGKQKSDVTDSAELYIWQAGWLWGDKKAKNELITNQQT